MQKTTLSACEYKYGKTLPWQNIANMAVSPYGAMAKHCHTNMAMSFASHHMAKHCHIGTRTRTVLSFASHHTAKQHSPRASTNMASFTNMAKQICPHELHLCIQTYLSRFH